MKPPFSLRNAYKKNYVNGVAIIVDGPSIAELEKSYDEYVTTLRNEIKSLRSDRKPIAKSVARKWKRKLLKAVKSL